MKALPEGYEDIGEKETGYQNFKKVVELNPNNTYAENVSKNLKVINNYDLGLLICPLVCTLAFSVPKGINCHPLLLLAMNYSGSSYFTRGLHVVIWLLLLSIRSSCFMAKPLMD